MDWKRISGLWHEYQGIAKANWGRLTDNDLTAISGSRDLMIGKLQTRYGMTTDQAEQQIESWLATLALKAEKPLEDAAAYMADPARNVANALAGAASKSIRENSALVFGVTVIACFTLGALWKRIVR